MAIRNTRTGGARKLVAGETKKGATPKKKGAATKVITSDRLPNGQRNNYKPNTPTSNNTVPEGSTTNKKKPTPDGDTPVNTKKVKPNDPMHPERVAPRTRRLPSSTPKETTTKTPVSKPAVKAPVKTTTRPNPGMVSKPAVKAPAKKSTR